METQETTNSISSSTEVIPKVHVHSTNLTEIKSLVLNLQPLKGFGLIIKYLHQNQAENGNTRHIGYDNTTNLKVDLNNNLVQIKSVNPIEAKCVTEDSEFQEDFYFKASKTATHSCPFFDDFLKLNSRSSILYHIKTWWRFIITLVIALPISIILFVFRLFNPEQMTHSTNSFSNCHANSNQPKKDP